MFLAHRNKLCTLFSCYCWFGTHSRPALLTRCQHEPTGSRRGTQRPDRGQGWAISLRNTNQAKICSLPKLAEVFPIIFVSSSVLVVNFKHVWLDKEKHRGQSWAATTCTCFSAVLLIYTCAALLQTWLQDPKNHRSHNSNVASLPCRGSWWQRIIQAMP